MIKNFLKLIIVLVLFLGSASSPAYATDHLDIVTGLNTLPFLISKISGDITMAVVYDPTNPLSKADADNIKKIVDEGIKLPGDAKLSALLVGVNQLAKLSRTQIAFLTPYLEPFRANINTATSAARILSFSTDLNCVKNSECIIGVSTKGNISVYFNKGAAESAKLEFSQEFSLLVKEF